MHLPLIIASSRIPAVETSQAGPGNLEVTVNGGRVPTSAQAQGQHTYAISFTPREAQNHTVELRFNGQDVPGSPFTCKVRHIPTATPKPHPLAPSVRPEEKHWRVA